MSIFSFKKVEGKQYLFSNKDLFKLILPLIVEQFLAIMAGMADSIMISSVGEAAVSGVSLVDSINILIIQVFAALATGGAVVVGQYLGQKRDSNASKAATQLVWFMGTVALILMTIFYICNDMILRGVFGRIDANVMRHAKIYLLIVAASIPFIAVYNSGAAIFRTLGNSGTPMKVSAIANAINVIGNATLIYGFHRGTEGVAIPTLVSRMFQAIVIIAFLFNKKRRVYIEKTLRFKFDFSLVSKILKIGIPNGLENSMFQLGKLLVLSLVATFGTYAIAANAVGNTIATVQVLPGSAIGLALTTVIARCVGAGDYEQAKYYNKKLMAIMELGMFIMCGGIILLLPIIMKIYGLSGTTTHMATQILLLHGGCGMAIWAISFGLPATFRAAGDAKVCMMISIFSMWVFRIGLSYLFGKFLGLGLLGVWMAMISDWIFRSICFIVRYFSGKWKKAAIV